MSQCSQGKKTGPVIGRYLGAVVMRILHLILVVAIGFGAFGCSKFKRYDGPEVTRILVFKEKRAMYLMHHDEVLKSYDVGLGFAPEGHKQFRGDGKTPEGTYVINRRNPNSEYHLSIGISYPRPQDSAFARANGKSAGGDIFVHGAPNKRGAPRDWTAGCIAVTDREIEDIYAMVNDGTVISIYP